MTVSMSTRGLPVFVSLLNFPGKDQFGRVSQQTGVRQE